MKSANYQKSLKILINKLDLVAKNIPAIMIPDQVDFIGKSYHVIKVKIISILFKAFEKVERKAIFCNSLVEVILA